MSHNYLRSLSCCCRIESPMPKASNAFQALVSVPKQYPALLKISDDSNTKLRIPNLQNIQKIKNYKNKWYTRSHILAISLAPAYTKRVRRYLWSPNDVARPATPAPTITMSSGTASMIALLQVLLQALWFILVSVSYILKQLNNFDLKMNLDER